MRTAGRGIPTVTQCLRVGEDPIAAELAEVEENKDAAHEEDAGPEYARCCDAEELKVGERG